MLKFGELNRGQYHVSRGVMKKMVDDRYSYLAKQSKKEQVRALGNVDPRLEADARRNRVNARTLLVK
jgi:hypothetical protein